MCFISGAREAVFPPVIYSNYVGENWKKKENLLMNFVLFMIFFEDKQPIFKSKEKQPKILVLKEINRNFVGGIFNLSLVICKKLGKFMNFFCNFGFVK